MGEPFLTPCLIQPHSHFFLIGNKTFIEKNEHQVHDDEHSGHEKIQKSRAKANR